MCVTLVEEAGVTISRVAGAVRAVDLRSGGVDADARRMCKFDLRRIAASYKTLGLAFTGVPRRPRPAQTSSARMVRTLAPFPAVPPDYERIECRHEQQSANV